MKKRNPLESNSRGFLFLIKKIIVKNYNMKYIGKEDEKITIVYRTYYKGYENIHIKTNYDTYKFGIELHSKCCEDFGIKFVDDEDYEWHLRVIDDVVDNDDDSDSIDTYDEYNRILLKGHTLDKIEYCHERSNGETLSLRIKTTVNNEEFTFYIDIYNDHNGYYPHDYFVEWNDYRSEGEL